MIRLMETQNTNSDDPGLIINNEKFLIYIEDNSEYLIYIDNLDTYGAN